MAEWIVREAHNFKIVGSSPRCRRFVSNSRLIFTFFIALFRTPELLFVVLSLVVAKHSFASVL